jgi:alpha-L-fucosidase
MTDSYESHFESLTGYTVPEWYKDAKLGIFIHWGPYAVPAYDNEWYPRQMYNRDSDSFEHHREHWGEQGEFGYKDFIPKFTAEHWDPDAWAELFADSGAQYVVPVGEHHDGFAMYDSSYTEWNSVAKGPERDVIGELGDAVRDRDLRLGVSSHQAWNWRYYTYEDDFDTTDPAYEGLYAEPHEFGEPASEEFLEEWYGRTCEMVDEYDPAILYFDFGWFYDEFAPYRPRIAAHHYNAAQERGEEVVLNSKPECVDQMLSNQGEPAVDTVREKFPAGSVVGDVERGSQDEIRHHYWQTDTSVSYTSWGYVEDHEYKDAGTIVRELADVVSKNGNLLLNVGPKPDGTIPEREQELLRSLGEWLDVNGEAIYGTRPWLTFGEGPTSAASGQHAETQDLTYTAEDVRFTRDGETIYAILMHWSDEVTVQSLSSDRGYLPRSIDTVRLLGHGGDVEWSRDGDGLQVTLPSDPPCDHATVLEVTPA